MKDSQHDIVRDIARDDAKAEADMDYVGGKAGADDMRLGMSALKENQDYVDRGLLNKETGAWIGRTRKGKGIVMRNLLPSQNYINNFDAIVWNTPKEQRMT